MGKCFHTTTVKADIDEVWSALSNFHDLGWAAGVIESVENIGDKGPSQVGSRRKLNGAISETLQSIDPTSHSLSYSIDDGPGPLSGDVVASYTGAIRLIPLTTGGGTFVQWTSEYQAKDEAAIGEFCNPIYAALMNKLRDHFGA